MGIRRGLWIRLTVGAAAVLLAFGALTSGALGSVRAAHVAKKPSKPALAFTVAGDLSGTATASTVTACGIVSTPFVGQTTRPWGLEGSVTINGTTYMVTIGIGKPPYHGKGTYQVVLDPAQPVVVDLAGDPSQQTQVTFPGGSETLTADWSTKNAKATGTVTLTALGSGSLNVTLIRGVSSSTFSVGPGSAGPPPLPTVQLTGTFRCKSTTKK